MQSVPHLEILTAIAFVLASFSQTGIAAAQSLPSEVQVRDHTNGLRSASLSRPLRASSIVAVEIAAGSLNDSDATPGLAHLAEHVFLRQRVDASNDVSLRDFITLHGGRLDAKTSYESTRFYFEVNNNALPTLLKTLHQFFSAPQVSSLIIASEIAAINDEFSFLKTKLSWRLRDALKAATAQSHPFRRFSAGNLESFAAHDLDVLGIELRNFFREHYSSAKMSVFLVSPHSQAAQQNNLNSSFGKLPSSNLTLTPLPALFDPATLPLELAIRENAGTTQLQLLIPLNDIPRDHADDAIAYLEFWSQAEGAGSWSHQLLNTGLLSQIEFGPGISVGESATISVSMTPTAQGKANSDHLIHTVIQSLQTLVTQAQTSPLFDDFIRQQANAMVPPALIDRDYSYSVLNQLGESRPEQPGNLPPYFVFGEEFKSRLQARNTVRIRVDNEIVANQQSPVFAVPYHMNATQDVPANLTASLGNFTPPVQLGEMNALPALAQYAEAPDLVLQTPSLTTWHSLGQPSDQQLLVRLSLDLPDASQSLGNRTLGELWYEALKRASRETGAKWYQHSHGVGLQLRGDLAGLQQQLQDVSTLLATRLSDNEFAAIKADLIRNWQTPPQYRFAFEALVDKLREVVLISEDGAQDKINALHPLDVTAFDKLRRESLQSLNATLYIYGATREQAELLSRSFAIEHAVEHSITDTQFAVAPNSPFTDDSLALELGSDANALLHFQEAPSSLPEDDAKFQLLLPLIKRQYFSSLREEQKLAYGVTVVPVNLDAHRGLALIAQSAHVSPEALQSATRQFLRDFPQWLNTLPEERFEQLKLSLGDQLSSIPLQGEALADHYWSQIADKRSSGDWNTAVKKALGQIDREELSAYFNSVFSSSRSLTLQGWPEREG